MLRKVGCSALVIAACAMSVASSARAQFSVEIGATIGRYAPLGSFNRTAVYDVSLPRSPGDLGGAALGGELRVWIAPRLGVAFTGSTVSTRLSGVSTPNGYHPPKSARVSAGSAELLFRVTGDGSRARAWVSAGGGLVKHGGDVYERYDDPVNFTGVVGVGSAIRIKGGLNAELGVATMIYNMNISGDKLGFAPGELSERGTQVDMLLRTGLSYTIH